MKIGIFGNTNNYPKLLAQGLKNLGCEVRLVVNRPEDLHRPESKQPDLAGNYPSWIGDFSALVSSPVVTESPLIPEVMRFMGDDLDAVFLNDVGPALNDGRFKCPVLALLTGSDLLYHASRVSVTERISGWPPEWHHTPRGKRTLAQLEQVVEAQREGIRRAQAVSFMLPGTIPEGDEILRSLGVDLQDPRRFFVYLSNTIDLAHGPAPQRRRMRVFNGARIIWNRPLPPGFSDLDDKGTDVLVKGFAAYLGRGGEGELRLVNKGYDVERTRQLIAELGIGEDVEWLDELPLTAFYEEVEKADVVCDQFGTSMPGMVALDAMAMGRVVLSNFRLEHMGPYYPPPHPFLQAATPDEVCEALWSLYLHPAKRAEMGAQASAYVRAHRSPEANARLCLDRLGLALPSSS
jgi:glycosyltransferase involved in cell wall biosynthesis